MNFTVNDREGKFPKAWAKFAKQRQSEKNKPNDILKKLIEVLQSNPKDQSPPFKLHPINKYKNINLWGAHIYDRYGDRLTYTVDEKTKTVTLIDVGGHEVYESEQ